MKYAETQKETHYRSCGEVTWIIPWPCANTSMSSTFIAVFSSALLTAGTEGLIPFCFSPSAHKNHTLASDLHSHTHTHTPLYSTCESTVHEPGRT